MPTQCFTYIVVSEDDVLSAIKMLNLNSAPGCDDIYPVFFKENGLLPHSTFETFKIK